MRLEHTFTVPSPVEQAWETLLDVERIAPCLPGAKLTAFDGEDFAGTVKVKVGPITVTYRGDGKFVERDEAARRVVIEASGKEARGPGTARATITANLTADGTGTRVEVLTDLTVTGRPAQFGRSVLSDVSAKLIGRFADCLATTITTPADDEAISPGGEASAAGAPTGSVAADDAGSARETTARGDARKNAGPGGAPEAAGPGIAGDTAAMGHPDGHDPGRTVGTATAGPQPDNNSEVEPIDLLEVTGAGALARRLAPYALAFAAGGLVVWLATRRRGQ